MKTVQTSLAYQVAAFDERKPGIHPALFLLHGRGANEEDLLGLVPFLDTRLLCIAPRAPFDFSFGGFTWYDIRGVGTPEPDQFAESYDRLCTFLDDMQMNYPIDPARTFLLGFSMGTVMSYSMSLTKPDRIKGVAAHSGYIPENTALQFRWNTLAGTSFFVAHGVDDPVIPVTFGRRAKELLSKTNAPLTYREYPIQHQISDKSLADLSSWLTGLLNSNT